MIIKGLPNFQKKALKSVLSKDKIDGAFEIQFADRISLKRLNSLWYGGNVVDVKYKGYTFHIEAIGDVYADLYLAHNNEHLCYAKDKNNNGNFGSQMLSYFRSDKTLLAALRGESSKYRLEMQHNNWWECFVTDPQGGSHDLMWSLDDDNLLHAISSVIKALDSTIDSLESKE